MLVITRKLETAFYIENTETKDLIKVVIVQVKGKQVRVGIDAPKHLKVFREEHLNGKASKSGDAGEDS